MNAAARVHGPGRGLVSVQRECVSENAQRMDADDTPTYLPC